MDNKTNDYLKHTHLNHAETESGILLLIYSRYVHTSDFEINVFEKCVKTILDSRNIHL